MAKSKVGTGVVTGYYGGSTISMILEARVQ